MDGCNDDVAKFKKALNRCPVCHSHTYKQDDHMGTFYIHCSQCTFRAELDYE